jgi:SAM-dependent methyltransferase
MTDLVMSWSVFEHVSNPVVVLSEIHRILRPGGLMFLQIWPLYHSQRGSHLWNWYPDGWEHLLQTSNDLRSDFVNNFEVEESLREEMLIDYDSLNKITVDQLQRAILSAGLTIRRIELQSDQIDVPESLSHLSLFDLTTSGIKILAQRT